MPKVSGIVDVKEVFKIKNHFLGIFGPEIGLEPLQFGSEIIDKIDRFFSGFRSF